MIHEVVKISFGGRAGRYRIGGDGVMIREELIQQVCEVRHRSERLIVMIIREGDG